MHRPLNSQTKINNTNLSNGYKNNEIKQRHWAADIVIYYVSSYVPFFVSFLLNETIKKQA